MKEPFIFLCPEITREHALTLMAWLEDEEVRRYLSDTQDVSDDIGRLLERVNLPVLTQIFNSDGRFFIVYDKNDTPVGFVRLIRNGADYEIVIVIGDRSNWNKKLGTSAIRESMKVAFFECRARRLTAKIHMKNTRSLRAFARAGFRLERENGGLLSYAITMEQYLQRKKEEAAAMPADITITDIDKQRLLKLLDRMTRGASALSVVRLVEELERAAVVDAREVPGDVVTMNSRARLRLNGEDVEVCLVYPDEADLDEMKLSVFSPIGTAILGYQEGSVIQWEVPSGISTIHIAKVLYQPEAAGDYHL